MEEPAPILSYASGAVQADDLIARCRRAVGWVAVLYSAVTAVQAGLSMMSMYRYMANPAPAYPREYLIGYIASSGYKAGAHCVMIVAGILLLKEARNAVGLLRLACWALILGGAVTAFAIPWSLSSLVNPWFNAVSYAMSFLGSSAMPVLMLLLPLGVSGTGNDRSVQNS